MGAKLVQAERKSKFTCCFSRCSLVSNHKWIKVNDFVRYDSVVYLIFFTKFVVLTRISVLL